MSNEAPPPFIPGHLFQSDPTCREIGGRFWMFCTHDQSTTAFEASADFWDNMYSYQAYSTADFTEWVSHGSILSRFDIAWADANALWDGDAGIAGPDGRFYAYMPFRCVSPRTGRWTFKMAVMAAERAEGPYRDVLGEPFLTDEHLLAQGIALPEGREGNLCLSPTVTYDEQARPWLLFGQFKAFIAPLAPSMTALAGPIRELEIPLKGGEAVEYIEGPMLDRVHDRWLFTYMTYKNWQGVPNANFTEEDPAGPYIQVCESASMFGPFRHPRHWIYPFRPDDHNVQHCLARFGERWIVAYHLPWRSGSQARKTCVTAIRFDTDGRPVPIRPAEDHGLGDPLQRRLVLAARAKRFAQEFSECDGVELVQGPLKSRHVLLKPGSWIKFPSLRFSGDESKLSFGLLSGEQPPGSVELQARLDHPDGEVIAGADAAAHAGRELCTSRLEPIAGEHDLYIVAKAQGRGATAARLHWFSIE